MSIGRRVAVNAGAAFGNQAALSAVGLFATAVFVRVLGAERFGGWGLIVGCVACASLFDLGLGVALVRRVAAAREDHDEEAARRAAGAALWASAWLGLVAAALVGAIAAPLAGWLHVPAAHRDEFVLALRIAGIGAGLTVPSIALGAVPTALHRLDSVLRLELVVTAAMMMTQVVVVLAGGGVIGLATALLAARAASLAGRYVLARRMLGALPVAIGGYPLWAELGRFGALKAVHQLSSQLVLYLDRFLVGAFLSVEAVAYYTVAVELAQRLLALQANVSVAFYPAACALARDPGALAALYQRTSRVVALLIFPAALALLFLVAPLLTLWVGPEYAVHSAGVLRLLAVGYALMALAAIPAGTADALGRPDLCARYGLASLGINVILSLILIPRFGLLGAGWALVGNVLLQQPFFLRTVTVGLVGIPLGAYARRAILEPLAASLAMGAAVAPVAFGALRERPLAALATAVVGAGLLAATVRLTGFFDASERAFVSGLPGGRVLRLLTGP